MDKLLSLLILLHAVCVTAQENPNVILPEGTYPYWSVYQHLEVADIDTIQAQKWVEKEHVIHGWDWSFPGFVEPAARSSVGLQQNPM